MMFEPHPKIRSGLDLGQPERRREAQDSRFGSREVGFIGRERFDLDEFAEPVGRVERYFHVSAHARETK